MKLAILFLVALPATCFGLQCYQCSHLTPQLPGEDNTEFPGCRDGTQYLEECTDDPIPIPLQSKFLMALGLANSDLLTKDTKQEPGYSCASLVGAGYGVNGAYRGCVSKVPDLCETAGQLASVELCFCNTNGCNNHVVPTRT